MLRAGRGAIPPSLDEEADGVSYKWLGDISRLPALVLLEDINLPDVCQKLNRAERSKTSYPWDSWPPELVDRGREWNGPPVTPEEVVSDLLCHLDAHKSMGPDGIHPRVTCLVDEGKAVALDCSKAFDTVFHAMLLEKLQPMAWPDGLENVQQKEIFKENEKKTQLREELCAANSVDTLMAEMPFVDTDIEDECAMHATSEINTKKKRKRTTGREIEEGIERKKKKNKQCQPNYFISLPITNPEITVSVQAVQDAIIQKDQRLSKAMVRSGSLHVTMLVMHLSNEEEISTAVGALSDSKVFVEGLLKGKRVDLSFQGIDHFRNQVGFVKLAENTTILTEIAETMRKIFQEKGILAGEERAFKPHLTFMKLSKSTELRKEVSLDFM
ncbi:A-kinase anchor protein 7 isoform X1 [Willisornis vidua]|uniref:A-kinase anchor protein 7 isoform X1 n=1 Tax=Willisornis vidua TaxID=1566151 RepID=A0ABQ9CRR2_9PASS|nr:A-kinase anchor protein 7 isoform X1 [Willisornis vidua]